MKEVDTIQYVPCIQLCNFLHNQVKAVIALLGNLRRLDTKETASIAKFVLNEITSELCFKVLFHLKHQAWSSWTEVNIWTSYSVKQY